MSKDHKEELIVMLKRQNADLQNQLKLQQKQVEEMKKGESGAEAKLKAQSELHA